MDHGVLKLAIWGHGVFSREIMQAWVRFISWIQWIHWKTAGTLKRCTAFQSPGGALEYSNKHSQIVFIDCFYWSIWVAISGLPPTCSPSFSFMGGVGKKLVTKTWMWEIFLQGHILSVGEPLMLLHTYFFYPGLQWLAMICLEVQELIVDWHVDCSLSPSIGGICIIY
jgi:hypothetical protein